MFARLVLAMISAAGLTACIAPEPMQTDGHADQQAWTQACKDWDEWDKAAPPFHISGNAYYVGTCGIAAILVTGDQGHVLIDSGTEAGAEIVAANVKKLGFRLSDVKLLLQTHEHFDHVGGMALLQRLTGARVIASPDAAAVLITGKAATNDPQIGELEPFAPVPAVEALPPDMTIRLGSIVLHAIATPGHTSGALSWNWRSCKESDCKTIAYVDSLSPVSNDTYRFGDHVDLITAFRRSIDKVASLDCDILLTPHPSASTMRDKLVAGDLAGGMNCAQYAAGLRQRLDQRLADEAAKTK